MQQLNKDINIFVSCHKDFFVPKVKYLVPIHVGAKTSSIKLDMLRDDTGDNISELNPYFCELTAQYWAWKNVDCDYYGFFHYRRYLSFSKPILDKSRAYTDLFLEGINNSTLKLLNINEKSIEDTISQYDVVLPIKAKLVNTSNSNTLYNHYLNSPHHNIKDLETAGEIIKKIYPNFSKYVDEAFVLKECYFLNIFIMKKQYFKEYCEWLFPILFEFHKNRDYSNSSVFDMRVPGLIAERIFNVFILYLKDKYKNIKIKELQNTYFEDASNNYIDPPNDDCVSICFSIDNNYAKHLSVALVSLKCQIKPDRFYDIIIFDNHLIFYHKRLLTSIFDNLPNVSVRFLKVADYIDGKKLFEKGHLNKNVYSRFAIFDLLKKYKKILYCDCDLLFVDDPSPLFDTNVDDYCIAAVKDSVMCAWNHEPHEFGYRMVKYNKEIVELKNPDDYFNSGVLLFNIKNIIDKGISTKNFIEMAEKRNWNWQDQDILNNVFKDSVLFVDKKWNVMVHENTEEAKLMEADMPKNEYITFMKARNNPSIIHFAGHYQPMYHNDVLYSELYWKFARVSPYYEILIKEGIQATSNRRSFFSKIINFVFPVGTKRRVKAKALSKRLISKLIPYKSNKRTKIKKWAEKNKLLD